MSAGDWKDMLGAIQQGNVEVVKYHVDMGVDVNYQHPEFLTTPLIESIEHDQIKIARLLLDNGADPNLAIWLSSDTPLKIAKRLKNKEFIALLKKFGAKDGWLW